MRWYNTYRYDLRHFESHQIYGISYHKYSSGDGASAETHSAVRRSIANSFTELTLMTCSCARDRKMFGSSFPPEGPQSIHP
jgi:hypothetical protein